MNELQQWLDDSERDYATGVALFAKHSKNKALIRYFQTSTAQFRMRKLVYEMEKLINTTAEKSMLRVEKSTLRMDFIGTGRAPFRNQPLIPDFILAAKKEISSLYSLIDKQHRELYDIGTSNADDVVRHRKSILDGRKPSIERADRLYLLKEKWFALEDGHVQERVTKEIREMLAAPLNEQPTIGIENCDGVKKMTDLELTKRRSALRSSITKTQNMLQYQSIRKGNTPTPLPKGPKRNEYEQKLKALKAEFKAVCDEMERRQKH